jgi:hypothetical protein
MSQYLTFNLSNANVLKKSKYPQSEVIGIDLTLIQPEMYDLSKLIRVSCCLQKSRIPLNLKFIQMDFDSPWHGMGLDSFDLIHMRMLCGSVSNWAELYAKAFRYKLN